jgi:hypothetical protein
LQKEYYLLPAKTAQLSCGIYTKERRKFQSMWDNWLFSLRVWHGIMKGLKIFIGRKLLASTWKDKTVKIVDIREKKILNDFEGHLVK